MSTVSGIGIRYADQPNKATSAASIVGGTNSKRSSPVFASDVGQRWHRFVATAEGAVVHPREVRDVDEVLHPPRRRRGPRVRRAGEHLEARVAPRRVRGHRGRCARRRAAPTPGRARARRRSPARRARSGIAPPGSDGMSVQRPAASKHHPWLAHRSTPSSTQPDREPGRPVRAAIDHRHHVRSVPVRRGRRPPAACRAAAPPPGAARPPRARRGSTPGASSAATRRRDRAPCQRRILQQTVNARGVAIV